MARLTNGPITGYCVGDDAEDNAARKYPNCRKWYRFDMREDIAEEILAIVGDAEPDSEQQKELIQIIAGAFAHAINNT